MLNNLELTSNTKLSLITKNIREEKLCYIRFKRKLLSLVRGIRGNKEGIKKKNAIMPKKI